MYIIAEIGINHNGDLALAKEMIDMAKGCGANAVKFQKRTIDVVYTPEFLSGPRETPPGVMKKLPFGGTTQRQQKEALELSQLDYDLIDMHCRTIGIDWFGSAWDLESLLFLNSYHPPYHKIASPMLTNLGFIEEVAKLGIKTIISTGMSLLQDIQNAVNIFDNHGTDFVLMHCISIYPCPPDMCNVGRIKYLQEQFPGIEIGYSGHESGISPTLAAIALGATYIERHITLDRTMYGSDQSASLEPKGLARVAEYAREIEKCLTPSIEMHPKESANAKKLRYWEVA